jgi:hypothetical protein
MKRAGRLYHRLADYENLCLAFVKAAKGKHNRTEVIEFKKRFDDNIDTLRKAILNHEFSLGHYRFFHVSDPKPRNICAASFPERVLHHALMNVCEPILDSYMIHDSYACRKGKGGLMAIKRASYFARCFQWYLKLDIKKYFDSIDHDVLKTLLAHRIKDKKILSLFNKLLATYHTAPNKGVPIGNLISQHCANFYLSPFDRWIKETRKLKGYARYMDDFLVFHSHKAALKEELLHIQTFLADRLGLRLKENIQLNQSVRGIPFLGYRVFPHKIRLSKASGKRFIAKFYSYESKWVNGLWSMNELARHTEPLIAFTRHADADGFRRSVIQSTLSEILLCK